MSTDYVRQNEREKEIERRNKLELRGWGPVPEIVYNELFHLVIPAGAVKTNSSKRKTEEMADYPTYRPRHDPSAKYSSTRPENSFRERSRYYDDRR